MLIIACLFNSLIDYVEYINQHGSKHFRPSRCGNCGKRSLRCHGFYERKADRENFGKDSLNPSLNLKIFLQTLPAHLLSFAKLHFS